VEERGNPVTGVWEDEAVIASWIKHISTAAQDTDLCMATGESVSIADKHPKFIRCAGDSAKIISSNDTTGFTFRGRFTEGTQSCTIGAEASQKAHSVLRWLIQRQGKVFYDGKGNPGKTFVAWAASGGNIPDPLRGTDEILDDDTDEDQETGGGDVGQDYAVRLSKKIAGYRANIKNTENIVVIGLDSASPGRMSILFYREIAGSEFLDRVERWHSDFAWCQNYGKSKETGKRLRFVGAPSPADIAWAAYYANCHIDEKLIAATVERILPCIVDSARFPHDLLHAAIHRVNNRAGLANWEWEKALGIACALYKGTHQEENYKMSLEEERTTRDYLYGRLLAVADRVELTALGIAKEQRETNAARLMSRFADRPFSTWKTIELGLHRSYFARVSGKYPGLSAGYQELIDTIHALFNETDYVDDRRLSGEYLLGYHCQRRWLQEHSWQHGKWAAREKSGAGQDDENNDEEAGNGNVEQED